MPNKLPTYQRTPLRSDTIHNDNPTHMIDHRSMRSYECRRVLPGARALVVALAMTAASSASAGVLEAEWATMMDHDIVVEQQDGGHLEGKLIGVEEATIRLIQRDGHMVTMDRTSIQSARIRVDDGQPAQGGPPPASLSEPAPTPVPANATLTFDGLLGRQAVIVTGDGEVVGKLVELSNNAVVIELDDGERLTVDRTLILATRRRFSRQLHQPVPDATDDAALKAPSFTVGVSALNRCVHDQGEAHGRARARPARNALQVRLCRTWCWARVCCPIRRIQ
ncbi:hypothetical protein [Sorangium sp. So ce363]|uniref:hypothetical protein n=1 Tax=Sorangium sp. So ce363 TaxID=3133304 RepID=UPI003F5FA527